MVQESLFFHIIFVYKVNTITWKICSKHCSILESCVLCLLQVQIQYSNSPTIDMSSNISTLGILLFAHPITTYQKPLTTHTPLLIKGYWLQDAEQTQVLLMLSVDSQTPQQRCRARNNLVPKYQCKNHAETTLNF